nr:hypothetical protein Itr_chr05CG02950 [Ipomoea trifida]
MGIMNITVNGGAWSIRRLARPSPRRASQYRSFNGGSRRFTAENHRVPVAEIESFFSFKTAGILAVFYRFPRRTFRPIRFRIGRLVTASSLPHRRRNLGLRLLTIPRHIHILHFFFRPSELRVLLKKFSNQPEKFDPRVLVVSFSEEILKPA